MAVAGTVYWRGAPLASGTVTFYPASGDSGAAGGGLIQDGAFALPAAQGLTPGRYRVAVNSPQQVEVSEADYAAGKMPLESQDSIPAKYNTESMLEVEVSQTGENHFDLRLD